MHRVTPPPLPEWFKLAAPNSLVNAREVAKILGYKDYHSVHAEVHAGRLPGPAQTDTSMARNSAVRKGQRLGKNDKNYWTKAQVLAAYKARVNAAVEPKPEEK